MRAIDSALFAVVLDDTTSPSAEGITRQFLLGDGRNRWFDKSYALPATRASSDARSVGGKIAPGLRLTWFAHLGPSSRFSLLVSASGKTAINFEHSWGDGVAIVRFMNEIYKDSLKHAVTLKVSPQRMPAGTMAKRALF